MTLNKFSLNGLIKPLDKATVAVANIEYAYGFGVYETIRVINNIAYFLPEHAQRLLLSAQLIALDHNLSQAAVERNVRDLVQELATSETYNLKVLLVGAKDLANCLLYIFPTTPLFPVRKNQRDGVEVLTVSNERQFPNAKTLNMLPSYLAFRKAKSSGCYDALFTDRNDYLTEGTMTNFFLVKGKSIFSAPEDKILDGVTKRIVLDLATQNGFELEYKLARVEELGDYDAAFLTSTSSKVMPIQKIDDFAFETIADSVKTLAKLYDSFLASCDGVYGKSV